MLTRMQKPLRPRLTGQCPRHRHRLDELGSGSDDGQDEGDFQESEELMVRKAKM